MNPATVGRVAILGCGLIGTSAGMALRRSGVHVELYDRDPAVQAAAVRRGAGVPLGGGGRADVVVVATPPSAVARVLREAQQAALGAVYTDVASTKGRIAADAEAAGCDLATYVPGHPMAGRESSGPAAAQADLFTGRSWALCPRAETRQRPIRSVKELARLCGAAPVVLDPAAHDRIVAAVSHAPHLLSAAMAARFADGDQATLSLTGQGLRDVTRVAAGPPGLWHDILEHNAEEVAAVLDVVAEDLARAAAALRGGGRFGSRTVTDLLVRGNRGRAYITGAAAQVAA